MGGMIRNRPACDVVRETRNHMSCPLLLFLVTYSKFSPSSSEDGLKFMKLSNEPGPACGFTSVAGNWWLSSLNCRSCSGLGLV